MKTTKQVIICVICISAALFTGCAALKRAYTVTPTDPVTISQPVYGLGTNAAGVPVVIQTGTTNVTATRAHWQVNSNLAAGLETAKAINSVVPSPLSPIIGGLLGLTTTLLAIYGAKKSGQLTTSNAALAAVVTGVEAFNSLPLKQSIQTLAVANGSQEHLDKTVQAVSAEMPKTGAPN